MSGSLLDAAGPRRSPATLPGYLAGRSPRNKGMLSPADPPRVEEIIAVMRRAGSDRHGLRVRGLIAVLWRAGLRISEALALTEADVEPRRGSGYTVDPVELIDAGNKVVAVAQVNGVGLRARSPWRTGTSSPFSSRSRTGG